MERFLGRYEPYFYALLRIVSGFMFLLHGTQKLFAFPPPAQPSPGGTFMTVTGALELVLGLLIMIGFLGGYAGFLASGMMAVAYFMAHQPNGALPIQNGGELAALYCFIFLYIASRGSGVLSVDASMRRGTATTAPGVRA
ncbi:MAG TPA: DoxX family protein [Pyrinomonadaceae bacterium]|nr:DoxX family protein [Pyrinomonadaceae bacterium]